MNFHAKTNSDVFAVEGEHTIQDQNEEEDEQTFNVVDSSTEIEEKIEEERSPGSPDVVETYSTNLRPNEDEIQLLRLKLEEVKGLTVPDTLNQRGIYSIYYHYLTQLSTTLFMLRLKSLNKHVDFVCHELLKGLTVLGTLSPLGISPID